MTQAYYLPDSLAIPYDGVDAEHGRLIALLNAAWHIAETASGNAQAVDGTLAALSEAMAAHFAHEEHEMEILGYGELAQHKVHHLHCARKFAAIHKSINDCGPSKAVLDQIFDVLIEDIIRADSGFKSFLYAKGILR
ncbi:MAG: hemerythrin domain-containing protein [Alphaproteobacteria bacterium]|nr:hemerythrin domain-containing protein [Alphaproteobacteria bacterium]